MADRLLLRGGSVVSMDPDVGNLPKGDVLIEGDKIVQIAPNIQADAQVIDVSGDIVIPGLIDTHRHTWECVSINPGMTMSPLTSMTWASAWMLGAKIGRAHV